MAESSIPTVDAEHLRPNHSHPIDNAHWYEGSLETCITPAHNASSGLREISNDEDLREIDLNAVGDEFFLFSPRQTTDEDFSTSITDSKSEQDSDPLGSPSQTSKRVFTMDTHLSNVFDDFHCSSSKDPFGFEQTHSNTNSSSLMITNLDDIFMNEEDDQELLNATDQFFNRNYRRPIQEDVLYEVEHENSFSDNSQNTSSIVPTDEQVGNDPLAPASFHSSLLDIDQDWRKQRLLNIDWSFTASDSSATTCFLHRPRDEYSPDLHSSSVVHHVHLPGEHWDRLGPVAPYRHHGQSAEVGRLDPSDVGFDQSFVLHVEDSSSTLLGGLVLRS